MEYKIKTYVKGHAGYFQYSVNTAEQACEHAIAIVSAGVYRRVTPNGDFEVWPIYKVKVSGPGLDTEYPDEFVRT